MPLRAVESIFNSKSVVFMLVVGTMLNVVPESDVEEIRISCRCCCLDASCSDNFLVFLTEVPFVVVVFVVVDDAVLVPFIVFFLAGDPFSTN